MKKNMKFALVFMLTVLLMISATATAFAGTVSYGDDDAQKFIIAPENLFDKMQNVMPGDTCTEKITIKNNRLNNVKIKVYIRSLGAEENSAEFLSKLKLTVNAEDNDTAMFQAPADQTAQLSDWTYIGTVFSGGKIDLNISLEIPKDLDNAFQNAVGALNWEFAVEELPREEDDPSTGDESMIALFAALVAASVAIFVVAAVKRRKNAA